MKTTLIILLTAITFLKTTAQRTTWGNPDYLPYYSKYLSRIDTVSLNNNDVEIRLWFNDGANKINTATYVSLAKHDNKWSASYYNFITYMYIFKKDSMLVNKAEPVQLNYDSLYQQLLKDSLLTLNSDHMGELMDQKGQHRFSWTDAGPMNYTIQILTAKKRKQLNYKCPAYFLHKAGILEFAAPLKVISAILKLTGRMEPC